MVVVGGGESSFSGPETRFVLDQRTRPGQQRWCSVHRLAMVAQLALSLSRDGGPEEVLFGSPICRRARAWESV
jgi:hypothetical protein